jgi:hypothetical protein
LVVNGTVALAATAVGCGGGGVFHQRMDMPEHVKLQRIDQAVPTDGHRVTGEPGSPSAKTTIDGRQLPAPPQKFQGKIAKTAPESKPYWPATITPNEGAPNVLLIITDDAGYGVPGTFGGVIPTPALDRIAQNGNSCT